MDDKNNNLNHQLTEGEDYYWDPQGFMVLTELYLKKRGYCCHQGCRHCPYNHEGGSTDFIQKES